MPRPAHHGRRWALGAATAIVVLLALVAVAALRQRVPHQVETRVAAKGKSKPTPTPSPAPSQPPSVERTFTIEPSQGSAGSQIRVAGTGCFQNGGRIGEYVQILIQLEKSAVHVVRDRTSWT